MDRTAAAQVAPSEGREFDRKDLRLVVGRSADFGALAADCVALADTAGGRIEGGAGVSLLAGGPMGPDPALLERLVEGIVAAVSPLRIILFGSAARGEMGPDSDLDVLVVVPDGVDRLGKALEIYSKVRLGFAKDVVVATESDVSRHADNPYLLIRDALREGKELYRAPSPA